MKFENSSRTQEQSFAGGRLKNISCVKLAEDRCPIPRYFVSDNILLAGLHKVHLAYKW
jgi:hypothetical protein